MLSTYHLQLLESQFLEVIDKRQSRRREPILLSDGLKEAFCNSSVAEFYNFKEIMDTFTKLSGKMNFVTGFSDTDTVTPTTEADMFTLTKYTSAATI